MALECFNMAPIQIYFCLAKDDHISTKYTNGKLARLYTRFLDMINIRFLRF